MGEVLESRVGTQIVEQGIDAKVDEPIGTFLPGLFHPPESLVVFPQPGIERGKPAGGNVAAVRAALQLLDSATKLVVMPGGEDPAQHGHGDFLPPREGKRAFIFFRRFLAGAGALQDKTQERARGNIIRPQFQSEPQAVDGARVVASEVVDVAKVRVDGHGKGIDVVRRLDLSQRLIKPPERGKQACVRIMRPGIIGV